MKASAAEELKLTVVRYFVHMTRVAKQSGCGSLVEVGEVCADSHDYAFRNMSRVMAAGVTDWPWSVEHLVALWKPTSNGGRKEPRRCQN